MIDEAGVVVAGDPHPVEPRGEAGQQGAGVVRKAVAAEAVMEAVPEAVESGRAAALDVAGERGQGRMRIIGREQLAEPREPARLFEVQVGDQQRALRRPVERTFGAGEEVVTGERSGNHASSVRRERRAGGSA
jgi:hypothetical protein